MQWIMEIKETEMWKIYITDKDEQLVASEHVWGLH